MVCTCKSSAFFHPERLEISDDVTDSHFLHNSRILIYVVLVLQEFPPLGDQVGGVEHAHRVYSWSHHRVHGSHWSHVANRPHWVAWHGSHRHWTHWHTAHSWWHSSWQRGRHVGVHHRNSTHCVATFGSKIVEGSHLNIVLASIIEGVLDILLHPLVLALCLLEFLSEGT